MKRIYHFVSNIFGFFSTIFLLAILIVVILQVFFRYVAQIVVPWTEEFARYLCIWMVFMAAVAAIAKEVHIRVTFIIDRIPETLRNASLLFSYAAVFLFNLVVFLGSIELIRLNWAQQAVTFPLSVGVLYLAITISSFFIMIFLIILSCKRLQSMISGPNTTLAQDDQLDF